VNTLEDVRVVVVNDDSSQLVLTCKVLEREGFKVVPCESPAQAFAIMDEQGPPSLIITDLYMPGIDGWRFCRLLRSPEYPRLNAVPILVLSATYSGIDTQQVTADLGANGFLAMPYERTALIRHVKALLKGHTPNTSKTALIVGGSSEANSDLKSAFERRAYICTLALSDSEARFLIKESMPDVAVLSYLVSSADREQLLAELTLSGSPNVTILILGDQEDAQHAIELMEKGVDGFIREPFEIEELISLCEQGQREHSLMRIEEILEERTQELKRSENKHRLLLDSIRLPVIALDEDRTILYCNNIYAESVSQSPKELEGQNLFALLPELENTWLSVLYSKTLETKESQEGEGNLGDRYFKSRVYPSPWGILSVSEDITESKRLEEQLLQSNRLESIGKLAGGIAHEFNNLLTPIMGYTQMWISELAPGDSLRADLEVVQKSAQRASKLTCQLLAFSRRQVSEPKVIDLNQLTLDMSQMLRSVIDEDVELVMLLVPESEPVNADPTQIEQVLMNLVVNARDAMPKGGKLVIETTNVAVDEARAAQWAVRPGNYACIGVSDDGIGMGEEVKKRVFEPFFTTKEQGKGTGLGLSTCYGIIKQNGGHIEVDSEPDNGATFKIYLPCSTQRNSSVPIVEEERIIPNGKETILLAEDEPLVRSTCTRVLHNNGYKVLEAANGEEALRIVQNHSEGTIDLLLTDVVMPQMGGIELARRLGESRPDIKILLTSGYTDESIAPTVSEQGKLPFLQKPFLPADLLCRVREVLDC